MKQNLLDDPLPTIYQPPPLFQVAFVLWFCVLSRGGLHQCELSGGGSPRLLLNYFSSNLCIVGMHYAYQHMPLLLTVPMYTMLSTTHISTHAIIVDCTHVHHVVHYTHINTCHYCWLYPCTPCCPLHTYQHMPLLLTVPMYTMLSTTHISTHAIIVDCTHVHHVVH